MLARNLWKLNSFIMVEDVISILTICSHCYQIRHATEEARTRNATATLNMLLKNYDKRLRPKFGGKPSNLYFIFKDGWFIYFTFLNCIAASKSSIAFRSIFIKICQLSKFRIN